MAARLVSDVTFLRNAVVLRNGAQENKNTRMLSPEPYSSRHFVSGFDAPHGGECRFTGDSAGEPAS